MQMLNDIVRVAQRGCEEGSQRHKRENCKTFGEQLGRQVPRGVCDPSGQQDSEHEASQHSR